MNFGYKTLLALTLATAACWRAKAQVQLSDNAKNDTMEITNALAGPAITDDSTYILTADTLHQNSHKSWRDTPEGKVLIETWQRLLKDNGIYNEITNRDIDDLQAISKMDHRVVALAEGLKGYEMDGEDMLLSNADSLSLELERSARREANGPGGQCYAYLKYILSGTQPFALLEGVFAHQAQKGLRASPNFVTLTTSFKHMDKLIPGAVGNFGQGPGAVAGHILIGGIGDQKVVRNYTTDWGKVYSYHPAQDISDKCRNANTSGTRNHGRGHYAPKPLIFYTKNSTISTQTMLKVGVYYFRKNSSKLYFGLSDIREALKEISEKSWEEFAQKVQREQQSVSGFQLAESYDAYNKYPATRTIKNNGNKKVAPKKVAPRHKISKVPSQRT